MKYAALVSKSVSIPGDERSRTNPGHGYPAHTETYLEMVEFADKPAMEAWVASQTRGGYAPSFKLIQYEELRYETSVSVTVKVSP